MTQTVLRSLALLALALALNACSPRLMLARGLADQLAAQGQNAEEDLLLARDAAPYHLKLSESVLQAVPDHLPLAAAVASGFTQYAYAFVAFEADKLQTRDARAAQALNERAARLYARAHRHAIAALALRHPGLAQALAEGDQNPLRLASDEVEAAYWAAAAWGAQIALSKDKPDVVADLPLAVRLATLAFLVQPEYGQGALASLMGTLEAARPGGDQARARSYFERAVVAGGGRHAGVWVAQAEALALPNGDRPAFEILLRQALVAGGAQPDLNNQVMLQCAAWLLTTVDDRF